MAWTESYHCDVCNKARSERSEDWWLAWLEPVQVTPDAPDQSFLRMTNWNLLLAHSAGVRHLCGARCAQTLLDRWMTSSMEQDS